MAAHIRFALPRSSARASGAALVSSACLAGLLLAGCADTITYSRTETKQGQVLLAEGDGEEAAIIFANQVRRAPNDYRAHYHLGQARLATGRYPEAIHSFRTGLEVMPLSLRGREDEEYRFKLVDALSSALAVHDPDGAYLDQIASRGTGDKAIKLLVAMTHAKAGRPDNAIESFDAAIALARNDPQITKQYGLYLESISQPQQAEYYLRRAYRANTQDEQVAAALLRLGVVPGPAILSATELSRPPLPLGPIPEVKWGEKPAPAQPGEVIPPTQDSPRADGID